MVPWKTPALKSIRRRRRISRIKKSQSVPSFPQFVKEQMLKPQHSFPTYGFDPTSAAAPGNLAGQTSYSSSGKARPISNPQRYSSSVNLADTFLGNFNGEEWVSGNYAIAAASMDGEEDELERTSTQAGQFNSTRAESETIEIAGCPNIDPYRDPIPKSEMPHFVLRERKKVIEYLPLHVRLYQAALKGDWGIAKSVIDIYKPAVRVAITGGSETALHIAAAAKQTAFVEKLVEKMTIDDLALTNKHKNTALCFAAASGIVRIAEVMVMKNQKLPLIRGHGEATPLFMAVTYKRKDMVSYLFSVTEFEALTIDEQIGLLIATVSTDYFDIGLKILQKNPKLATMRGEDDETALHVMAQKPSVIGSRSQLNIWEKFINLGIKRVYRKSMMKALARQLVDSLWKSILSELKEEEMLEFIKYPTRLLHDAASVGNVEFLIVLISSYPDLVWKVDDDQKSIFHIAVENRHESVFNLIYEIGGLKDFIANYINESNHNMLHLAGKLAATHHLNRVSGAALQMQRELLWFKEVEKIVLPSHLKMKCEIPAEQDKMTWLWLKQMEKLPPHLKMQFDVPEPDESLKLTPRELFTKEHKTLRKDGEDWMKNTANSCMLVATLIATVVFAAAFTVPGGNDNNTGFPMLQRKHWFTVFVISDALALVSSTTSILIFLSILTSRYAEDDFLHSLPSRLLFGLASLFISIVCMVVAFSATFFILYNKGRVWVPVTIAAMAIIPVSCFGLLEYKLWADTFRTTYWSRFLFKPRQHKLF